MLKLTFVGGAGKVTGSNFLVEGEKAKIGSVIIRKRGTRIIPGDNVRMGTDHTLFAIKTGTVKFTSMRKTRYDGKIVVRKVANIR